MKLSWISPKADATTERSALQQSFWFSPSTPTNLGFCRFSFCLLMLFHFRNHYHTGWASVSDVFWHPTPLFQLFSIPVFPDPVLYGLDIVWTVAIATSAIGLFTRTSTMVAFVLSFYLLGLPHNFGKVSHSDAMVVLIMGIFAASYCGHSWSLDSLWRRYRGRPFDTAMSSEYTWPIRLIWSLLVLIYFGAAVSKLTYGGWAWISGDTIARYLVTTQYTALPPTSWAPYVVQYGWICFLIALATVVLEFLAPLALVHPIARLILIPSLWLMQFGIWLLMGVMFFPSLSSGLFWIPWDRIGCILSRSSGNSALQSA